MTSVGSGQWLQNKECAARASTHGDCAPTGPALGQLHREDIPWGHMSKQEGHRLLSWSMTARTEPTALKSLSI